MQADASPYEKLANNLTQALLALKHRRPNDPQGKLCEALLKTFQKDTSSIEITQGFPPQYQKYFVQELIKHKIPHYPVHTADGTFCVLTDTQHHDAVLSIQQNILKLSPKYYKKHTFDTLINIEQQNTGYIYTFNTDLINPDILSNKAYDSGHGHVLAFDGNMGISGLGFKNINTCILDAVISDKGIEQPIKHQQILYDNKINNLIYDMLRNTNNKEAIYVVNQYDNTRNYAKIENGKLYFYKNKEGIDSKVEILSVDISQYNLDDPSEVKSVMASIDKITTDIESPEFAFGLSGYEEYKDIPLEDLQAKQMDATLGAINLLVHEPDKVSTLTNQRFTLSNEFLKKAEKYYKGQLDELKIELNNHRKELAKAKDELARDWINGLADGIKQDMTDLESLLFKTQELQYAKNIQKKGLDELRTYLKANVNQALPPIQKQEQERYLIMHVLAEKPDVDGNYHLCPKFHECISVNEKGDLVQTLSTVMNGVTVQECKTVINNAYEQKQQQLAKNQSQNSKTMPTII